MFFPDPARGLFEFHRVLAPGGWMAVSVTTVPDRSLFARIGAVVARYATESAEKLQPFFLDSRSESDACAHRERWIQ